MIFFLCFSYSSWTSHFFSFAVLSTFGWWILKKVSFISGWLCYLWCLASVFPLWLVGLPFHFLLCLSIVGILFCSGFVGVSVVCGICYMVGSDCLDCCFRIYGQYCNALGYGYSGCVFWQTVALTTTSELSNNEKAMRVVTVHAYCSSVDVRSCQNKFLVQMSLIFHPNSYELTSWIMQICCCNVCKYMFVVHDGHKLQQ